MTARDKPAGLGDNDWPEPEVKKYPGVVIVVGILLATSVLWSGCAFVGLRAAKLLSRPTAAAAASHDNRMASLGR